jgi:basic amino acid/polyamine antiporter, APA family
MSAEGWRDRYGVRPSLASLQSRADRTDLKRSLGAWELTLLGVGASVGAGIFTVSGLVAARYTGPSLALSFVLVGVLLVPIALAYAELATLIPLAGASYNYATAAFGELVGWLTAWGLLLGYAVGNGAVAAGFSANLAGLLAALGVGLPAALTAGPAEGGLINLPALLLVLGVSVVLLRPVREGAWANAALTTLKVGILGVFLVAALSVAQPANLQPLMPFGVGGFLAGASVILFAAPGFETIGAAAEEARRPQRDLMVAMLGSLGLVLMLYIAVALALTAAAPSALLDTGEPLAFALRRAGLPVVSVLVSLGALAATLSVFLVYQLATSRITLAVARDGLLPRWLGRVHPRHRTPNRATLALAGIVGASAALLPLEFLVQATNISFLWFFAICCAAVLALRKAEPAAPRRFRCPAVPWVPLAGIGGCLLLAASLGALIQLTFAAWMGAGLVLYAGYGVRRSALRAARA